MSIPLFDKNGNGFANPGSTFHPNGQIIHPFQRVGMIPLKGNRWSLAGLGASFSAAVRHFAGLPQPNSGEELQ